jgi:membrane protein implicated in regulation of membrane protease activity
MSVYWLWWIAAAILVGAELVTGTFYLLAVGVAAAMGGIAAWLGASLEMQFLIAGGLGVALTAAAHHWRVRQAMPPQQDSFDIGQAVQVLSSKPDGTVRVSYRGTEWDAELASPRAALSTTLYIVATKGSRLIVSERPPAAPTT